MAVTLREQRTAYDNIAVGAATGTERTIDGSAPPSQTYGGVDNLAVGETSRDPDNIAAAEDTNPYLERPGGA
jgi:hypothetical protein